MRDKHQPVRALPRRAPFLWVGFENAFWEQNMPEAIYHTRDVLEEDESSEEFEVSTKTTSREPSLTDLQKLIIDAIVLQNGSASTDEIEQHVGQYWSSLRKRDGTAYAYDCRRVVLASLANTSNIRPLFKRDTSRNDEQCWKLGPRGAEVDLEQLHAQLKVTKSGQTKKEQSTSQNRRKRTRSSDSDGDTHRTKRVSRHPATMDASTLTTMTPIQRAIAMHLFTLHRHSDSFENIAKLIVEKKLVPTTANDKVKRIHEELDKNPYLDHPPPFENALVEEVEWFTLARHVLDILKPLDSIFPPDALSMLIIGAVAGGAATESQILAHVKRHRSNVDSTHGVDSPPHNPDELRVVLHHTPEFFVFDEVSGQWSLTDEAKAFVNP